MTPKRKILMAPGFLLGAVLVAIISISPPDAWGQTDGRAGQDQSSCLENNPGKGAITLRGTVAVEMIGFLVIEGEPTTKPIFDVTLRVSKGSVNERFRVSLVANSLQQGPSLISDEEVLCLFLDKSGPNLVSDSIADVQAFDAAILEKFGFDSTWKFIVTSNSLTDAEPLGVDEDGNPVRSNMLIPGTQMTGAVAGQERGSSLADFNFYAVEP